jgi:sugar-specific transcriptional regulator TrmB
MKFNEYDAIKIISNPKDAEQDVVGYRGFVLQQRGIVEDGQQYLVALYSPDDIEDFQPVGGGVLVESCIDFCDDEGLVDAINKYKEWTQEKLDEAKQKANNVEEGLKVLAVKYDMTVEKLREIYTKVSDLIDTGSLNAKAE